MKKIRYTLLTKSVGLYINILSYIRPVQATKLAYRLFSSPRIGRLNEHNLPDILAKAERQRLAFGTEHLQTYTWEGNSNVILLVHGWESNASRWEKLIPYLRRTGSTVIAIDAPAHGLSTGTEFSVPRYAEFINVAVREYRPNHIIGHSIGGAACVYYQARHQNRDLKNMVLLGAPSDLSTLVQNYVRLLSLNRRMFGFLEQYFVENFNFRPEEFSGKIFGRSLKLQGLIAHDSEDNVVLIAEAHKFLESWKKATFLETKGLGHSMHDDNLYRRIAQFLVAGD
jgi:hypothetical protein